MNKFGKFFRGEEGSSTIEAVLWLPVFFVFFALVADASFLFFGQNKAYRIIQEANRTVSTGYLRGATEEETETLVEAFVRDSLDDYAPDAWVNADIAMGKITTQVRIPSNDLTITGVFGALTDVSVTAQATQFIEY